MSTARARALALGIMLVAVGACGDAGSTEPAIDDDDETSPFEPGDPPAESGQDFHLTFDGTNDRVLIPWDASFPTEVFTVSAWVGVTLTHSISGCSCRSPSGVTSVSPKRSSGAY